MSIRSTVRREFSFDPAGSVLVHRIECEFGERLRCEALETWPWADEQMIGEAWNEVLITLARWVVCGRYVPRTGDEAGWLWLMLRRHLLWIWQYDRVRARESLNQGRDELWWSRRAAVAVAHDDDDGQAEALLDLLTDREADVVSMLAAGMSRGQVARMLGLQRDTVKDYVKRARLKLLMSHLRWAGKPLVQGGLSSRQEVA